MYGFEDRLAKSVQRCLSISILRAMLAGFDEQDTFFGQPIPGGCEYPFSYLVRQRG